MSQSAQNFSVLDNISLARVNMIENQIRAGGITNRKVLGAMASVPRESFVLTPEGALAYAEVDAKLPNKERYLLSPPLLARLIDEAQIHDGDLVLDIGCANGYSTAILSDLVGIGTVVGLESDEELAAQATHQLEILDKNNVVIVEGELIKGYPQQGPYDVILLNGASAVEPSILESIFIDQLRENGRLVGVFDGGGDIKGVAWRWIKIEGSLRYEALFDARTPILPSFEALEVPFRFPGITEKKPSLKNKEGVSSNEDSSAKAKQEPEWQKEQALKGTSASASPSVSAELGDSNTAGSATATTPPPTATAPAHTPATPLPSARSKDMQEREKTSPSKQNIFKAAQKALMKGSATLLPKATSSLEKAKTLSKNILPHRGKKNLAGLAGAFAKRLPTTAPSTEQEKSKPSEKKSLTNETAKIKALSKVLEKASPTTLETQESPLSAPASPSKSAATAPKLDLSKTSLPKQSTPSTSESTTLKDEPALEKMWPPASKEKATAETLKASKRLAPSKSAMRSKLQEINSPKNENNSPPSTDKGNNKSSGEDK